MADETKVDERDGRGCQTEARNVRVERERDGRLRVTVCAGTACVFAGSLAVHDAFVEEVRAAGLESEVRVSIIGCHGLCSQSPVTVCSDDVFYGRLRPQDVKVVVDAALPRRRARREVHVQGPGDGRGRARLARHRLLPAADPHRAAQRRRDRPRKHRRGDHARRLRRRASGAHVKDARVDRRST